MDAKHAGFAVTLFLAICYAGCTLQDGRWVPRQSAQTAAAEEQPAQSPPAQTAATAAKPEESTDPEIQRVQQYIARVDDISAKTNRPDGNTPAQHWKDSYIPGRTPGNEQPQSPPARGTDNPQGLPTTPAEATTQPSGNGVTASNQIGYANSKESGHGAATQPATIESPILGEIGVRAAPIHAAMPTPADRADPDQTSSPSMNSPAIAAYAPVALDQLIEQWQAQPADGSYRQQLDQRLVMVLAGKYEDARRPLESVSDQQQQMAGRLVGMLINIRESHGGNPEAEARRVLSDVQGLTDSLLRVSDPEIAILALARAVRGFGQYEPFDPAEFPSGRHNEFVVYCELRNFQSRTTDDGWFESEFAMKTTILNRAGDTILEINDDPIKDKCRSRRHDCFIPRLVRLPATLSPGEYVVKLTIVDKIGEKVTEKRTTFRIVARS